MRLSDAIALGRTLITPRGGSLGNGVSGCALGMGLMAKGIVAKDEKLLTEPEMNWPWITKYMEFPCACSSKGMKLRAVDTIVHIFDSHITSDHCTDWTLDNLIDWVRSVEPAETEPAIAEGQHTSELVEKQP